MDFSTFPHKNLILSGLVALTIVGVGFYVNYQPSRGLQYAANSPDSSASDANPSSTSTELATRDSDQDGIPDWEENLKGSNPFLADTDRDGTNDGDEVKEGRSPIKANTAGTGMAPNDKLTLIQDPHFATSTTDVEGKRKEFFAKFLATQADEIRETTYRDLIKGFNPVKFKPTNELADLNISGDNSVEGLRAYGNAFGKIIEKYTSGNTNRKEEDILADGLKTKDDATLKELQLPALVYRQFSVDLKALKVPSDLANDHLLIVNGYDGMGRGLLGMQHLFSDPIDGAGGYQTYTRMRIDVTLGYSNVVTYFSTHGVTFANNEPGYPFYFNTVTQERGTTTIQ